MRIALTADPEIAVPPRLYGGIERIIDMLAVELTRRGHEVTLFARAGSKCPVTKVSWHGETSTSATDTVRNAATLTRCIAGGGFDIVHSFSRIAYMMPILPFPIPKVMSYQRAITPRAVQWGQALARGSLEFTAISSWMMRDVLDIGRWHLVPNGVSIDTYAFSRQVSEIAPFVFLGRIEEIKGPHLAIEIARRVRRPIVIAGNIPDAHRRWAEAHVLSHVDGVEIRYVGPVDDEQKSALLGSSSALLMPILWDEPFGIVMAEAMACGTPVLGIGRGAVSEVVEDGVTGFVRDDVAGLVSAASQLSRIDRAACRARVERLYSASAIADAYLAVYRRHAATGVAMRTAF